MWEKDLQKLGQFVYKTDRDGHIEEGMSGRDKHFPSLVFKQFQDERPDWGKVKALKVFKEQYLCEARGMWSFEVRKAEEVLEAKLERKLERKRKCQARMVRKIVRKMHAEFGVGGCLKRLRASGELLSNSMEGLRLSECDV